MSKDNRWEQRFANFKKALDKLDQAVNYIKDNFYQDGVFDEAKLIREKISSWRD